MIRAWALCFVSKVIPENHAVSWISPARSVCRKLIPACHKIGWHKPSVCLISCLRSKAAYSTCAWIVCTWLPMSLLIDILSDTVRTTFNYGGSANNSENPLINSLLKSVSANINFSSVSPDWLGDIVKWLWYSNMIGYGGVCFLMKAYLTSVSGRVTHICAGNSSVIGSDICLSPGRCQAIMCTNDGISVIGPLGTNFREVWTKFRYFHWRRHVWICRLQNGDHFVSASMCQSKISKTLDAL